jgi:hypothetical protein
MTGAGWAVPKDVSECEVHLAEFGELLLELCGAVALARGALSRERRRRRA